VAAALLFVVLAPLPEPAGAAKAKPGKPSAKTPSGTITTTKPTFKWSTAE